MAKIETTAAAVTNIENPLKLFEQGLVVVEILRPPVQRVTRGRLEAAFSLTHEGPAGPCSPAVSIVRDGLIVERIQGFLETIGMRALGLGQGLEPIGNLVKIFVARRLGHPRVHIGVLVGLTGNCGGQVV